MLAEVRTLDPKNRDRRMMLIEGKERIVQENDYFVVTEYRFEFAYRRIDFKDEPEEGVRDNEQKNED